MYKFSYHTLSLYLIIAEVQTTNFSYELVQEHELMD